MQSLDWYVHRLKSMSVGEIAWRVRSMLSANLDLVRIPLGFYPKLRNRDKLTLASFQPGFSCIDGRGSEQYGFRRAAVSRMAATAQLVMRTW